MNNYKYDAFISYRHLENDSIVAKKLQKLLEGYKPPKGTSCQHTSRIKRLFVDETELTSNGDLNNEIKGALEQSRFLIVVCSEKTKESKWCMQEIEYFKSLHNGHLDNILTILVSGEPENVFPEQLCFETKEVIDENGILQTIKYEVEPLAANVSANDLRQMMKKLKKEYLRLAAALVGCEFDSLYQRHKRRKVRNTIGTSAAILLITSAVGVTIHNQFVKSEENISLKLHSDAVSLMDLNNENYQKALYYLSESSIRHHPKQKYQNETIQKALRAGIYPVQSEKLNGKILGNAIVAETESENGYNEVFVSKDMKYVQACNPENGSMLMYSGGGYRTDKGEHISNEKFLTSCDNGRYWVFAENGQTVEGEAYSVNVYDSDSESVYILDFVAENNPRFDIKQDDTCYMSVDVCEEYAAITCRGYLYIYAFAEEKYSLYVTLPYDEFVSSVNADGKCILPVSNNIYLSGKMKLAVMDSLTETFVISLENGTLVTTIPHEGMFVSDFEFTELGSQFIVSYQPALKNSVGRWELYDYEYDLNTYKCVYSRQTENPLAQISFSENENVILARDFTNGVYVTTKNMEGRYEDYAPVYMNDKIKSITGGKNFAFAASTNDDTVYFIDVVRQKENQYNVNDDKGYPILEIHPTDDGNLALLSRKFLKIVDDKGVVKDTYYFDSKEYFDFLESNRHKFQMNFPMYDTEYGDWFYRDFPGAEKLGEKVKEQFVKYRIENEIPVNGDAASLSDSIRVSQDGKNIYIMNSSQPCLCSFKVTGETGVEIEHGIIYTSEVPVDLFDPLNGKQIAVTTESGKVLVYSLPLSDEPPKIIQTLNPGKIQEVRIDETGKYMALGIETDDYGVLELWDLENSNSLDEKTDGKTWISGICFCDDKLYYGFGEYMCYINLSYNKYSRGEYKMLKQLSGYDETKEKYIVPNKKDVNEILEIWNVDVYTYLSDSDSDELPIETKTKELSELVKGKSVEEKLKVLKENKDEFVKLYTGLKGIKFLSIYYSALIGFVKDVDGIEPAKVLAQEYCDIVAESVCKPIYEWTTIDRSIVMVNFYSDILKVYSEIPEGESVFEEFFDKVSSYNAEVLEKSKDIYDYFDILGLTENILDIISKIDSVPQQ